MCSDESKLKTHNTNELTGSSDASRRNRERQKKKHPSPPINKQETKLGQNAFYLQSRQNTKCDVIQPS